MRPATTPSTTLSPKDQKQFTDLLQLYEQKQLARGRKLADQILKKYPSHGETMCMKGLIMIHLGERAAGIKLARNGMRMNLKSHITWHVWALIQKGERNYEESLKAYMMALKIDKDNFNIIRETSSLQTHTRQYDALLESRLHMLRLKPTNRTHWLAVAVAYRLTGNLPEAKRILQSVDGFLRNIPIRDSEYGEFIFFYLSVLEDLGDVQEALSLLDQKAKGKYLVDRQAIVECRTRLFAKLKSTVDADSAQKADWTHSAEQSWRELIDTNPECHDYYKGFLANADIDLANLTDESRSLAVTILEEFASKLPKANAPRRLALTIAQGEKFRELATPYLERALQKGIPSLFGDVKNLYTDSNKLQTVQDLVEDFCKKVKPNHPPESPEPTDYLWTLYFLAQHYSFLGHQEKALDILKIAMEHTPTLPELYMMKARVLKRAGDPYGAVRAMDDARKLDGQDRFLNTKAGIYRLRAGLVAEAHVVFGLFTRKGMEPGADLIEMQALHYLRELGDIHRRLGNYNLALKAYYRLEKVFANFSGEQYDFHLYSVRRTLLNAYLDMLTWEDNVHSNPAYIHAAVWAARIWIKLYDNSSLINSLRPPGTKAELSKKELNKAKKAAHKAEAETSQEDDNTVTSKGEFWHHLFPFQNIQITFRSLARSKAIEDQGLEAPQPKDDDPEGLELVAADDPLEKASKFLGTLEVFGKVNMEVNVTMFDVAIRQKKYLKALKALRRAYACDSKHPEVHVRIVQFAQAVNALGETILEMVRSVIEEALSVMKPAEVSLERFNSEYLQLNSKSSLAVLASAKVSQSLGAPREELENLLFTTLADGIQLRIADGLEILAYLQQIQSPRADEFRIACDERFVLSKVFKSPEEQAVLRRQCVNPKDEKEVETVF